MNNPQGSNPEAPPPGRYRHYMGPEYQVLGVARLSETDEDHVVFRPRYGEGGLWIRPLAMFVEWEEVDGERRQRFELVVPDE